MKKYRKLIAAGIGLVLLALKELAGIELGITEDQIMTVVIAVATAFGVWAVPNWREE